VDCIVDQRRTAVCPIVNGNGHGQNRAVSRQQSPEVTADKLLTAGFEVHLIDGHDPDAITKALKTHTERHMSEGANPMAIVANTIKGWGFTEVLGSDVHGKPVPDDDMERALAALDQTAAELGAQPPSDSLSQLVAVLVQLTRSVQAYRVHGPNIPAQISVCMPQQVLCHLQR
jgi:transketolase